MPVTRHSASNSHHSTFSRTSNPPSTTQPPGEMFLLRHAWRGASLKLSWPVVPSAKAVFKTTSRSPRPSYLNAAPSSRPTPFLTYAPYNIPSCRAAVRQAELLLKSWGVMHKRVHRALCFRLGPTRLLPADSGIDVARNCRRHATRQRVKRPRLSASKKTPQKALSQEHAIKQQG